MIGLVLSGGESRRMGKDKGLLTQENISWAAIAFDKLRSLHLPVSLSIRTAQLANYSGAFNSDTIIPDKEDLQYQGPLLGLMSAHTNNPTQDILVLACDMLEMDAGILRLLMQQQQEKPEYQAYCFQNQGNLEPLAAIYTSSGLSLIQEKYLAGQLPRHSMKYVLSILNTLSMPLTNDQIGCFKNFNSPADLISL